MPEELKVSCAHPGPAGAESEAKAERKEKTMIMIGRKAPDFTAPSYYRGKFTNIKLSDYIGNWVVLCFYPGDFTFV